MVGAGRGASGMDVRRLRARAVPGGGPAGEPVVACAEPVEVPSAVDPVPLGKERAGTIRPGDLVTVLPSGRRSSVASIVTFDGNLPKADIGDAITVTLSDEVDISRGDVIVSSEDLPQVGNAFEATLVWLNQTPAQVGVSRLGTMFSTLRLPAKSASDTGFRSLPTSVKAVVLNAEGKHFSAGLDLSELKVLSTEEGIAHSRTWHGIFDRIEFGRVPVVTVMHGAVVGGGLELAAATHIRVAERRYREGPRHPR